MSALFQLYHDLGDHRDIETCRNDFVSVRKHLARRIAEQNPCVIHDEQAVSDLRNILHGVRDDEDGRAGLRVVIADKLEDLIAACRIEAGGRLVENEHIRTHGDHARDGNAALLTAGERERRLVSKLRGEAYRLH